MAQKFIKSQNNNSKYPRALIVGHHDLNPQKDCPCFDVVRDPTCHLD